MDWKSLLSNHSKDINQHNILKTNSETGEKASLFLKNKAVCTQESGYILVEGPDAEVFLQGQVTCDVSNVVQGASVNGAHLNPQGKVIFSFLLSKLKKGLIILDVNKSILATAMSSLEKYAVFSKVTLSLSENFYSFLISSKASDDLPKLTEHSSIQKLSKGIIYSIVPKTLFSKWFDLIKDDITLIHNDISRYIRINAGLTDIYPETSSKFIPQVLNYDLNNFISFEKGCYTGQEIVARTHYLGKAKKRVSLWEIKISKNINLNEKLFNCEKVAIATVVDSIRSSEKSLRALLVTAEENRETTEMFLDDNGVVAVKRLDFA